MLDKENTRVDIGGGYFYSHGDGLKNPITRKRSHCDVIVKINGEGKEAYISKIRKATIEEMYYYEQKAIYTEEKDTPINILDVWGKDDLV